MVCSIMTLFFLIMGALGASAEMRIEEDINFRRKRHSVPGEERIQKLEMKYANLEMLIYKLETERDFSFDSDVMLVGETDKSGTVYYRGQHVCDFGWGPEEAAVVCRELGYSTDIVIAKRNSHFGQPSQYGQSSWFSCSGSETSLSECRKMTAGRFCTSSNAAGVYCGSSLELRGGSGPHEGNVFYNGAPVCGINKNGDSDWRKVTKEKEATTVCRILGYTRATNAFYGKHGGSPFPKTTDPSILSGISCSGLETSLLDCTHEPLSWKESHQHCRTLTSSHFGLFTAGVMCE